MLGHPHSLCYENDGVLVTGEITDLKKPRICPIWSQSHPLWSQTYHPWLVESPAKTLIGVVFIKTSCLPAPGENSGAQKLQLALMSLWLSLASLIPDILETRLEFFCNVWKTRSDELTLLSCFLFRSRLNPHISIIDFRVYDGLVNKHNVLPNCNQS